MLVDHVNFRTQNWSPVVLPEIDLHFGPAPLRGLAGGEHSPFGFIAGPLVVHPVVLACANQDPDAPVGFRVSARDCGAAIAEFPRIELALGFLWEVIELDWHGDPAEIVERNRKPVLVAYQKWIDPFESFASAESVLTAAGPGSRVGG